MELAQGCRDKGELARLKTGFDARQTRVLQFTPQVSRRAAELIDLLALSHGLRLGDALIAATAVEEGSILLTANVKHFSVVPGLAIESFDPRG